MSNFDKVIKILGEFGGRMSRSQYWTWLLILTVVRGVVGVVIQVSVASETTYIYLQLFGDAVFMIPVLAILIKRLHDRDRSGWWVVMLFIPILNLWILIEAWFLKGSDGPNRFGSDTIQGGWLAISEAPPEQGSGSSP